jgi:hypothetical protein
MSARSGAPSSAFSRRIVLLHTAGCAAGAAALLLPLRQAAAKMKQPSVAYQDSPKGDQKCSNCSLFQEPMPVRLSTAISARRAGADSGSKRLAEGRPKILYFIHHPNGAARYPRGNRAACSPKPRSRLSTSIKSSRPRLRPALIFINRSAVAKKHQSTRNS